MKVTTAYIFLCIFDRDFSKCSGNHDLFYGILITTQCRIANVSLAKRTNVLNILLFTVGTLYYHNTLKILLHFACFFVFLCETWQKI